MMGQAKTIRVHVRSLEWERAVVAGIAVYCGRAVYRAKDPLCHVTSPYRNPFRIGARSCLRLRTREDVLGAFYAYWRDSPDLQARARRELLGKVLGCWCKPHEDCHCDIIICTLEMPVAA